MSASLEKSDLATEVSNVAIREWLLRRAKDKDTPVRRIAVPVLPLPTPSPSLHSNEVLATAARVATSTASSQSTARRHWQLLHKGTFTSPKPPLHSQPVASNVASTSSTAFGRKKRPGESTPGSPRNNGQKAAKLSSVEVPSNINGHSELEAIASTLPATDPMLDSTGLLWDLAAARAVKEWEASAFAAGNCAAEGSNSDHMPDSKSLLSPLLTSEVAFALANAVELWRRYDKDGYLFLRGIIGNAINEKNKTSDKSKYACTPADDAASTADTSAGTLAAVSTQVRNALAGHIARKHLRKKAGGSEAPAAVKVKSLRGFTVEGLSGEYIGSAARFKTNAKHADFESQATWRAIGRGKALRQLLKGDDETASKCMLMCKEASASSNCDESGSNYNDIDETNCMVARKTDASTLSAQITNGTASASSTSDSVKNGGKLRACEICCTVPDVIYGSGRFCSHVCLNRAKGKRHGVLTTVSKNESMSHIRSNVHKSSENSNLKTGLKDPTQNTATRTSNLTLVLAQLALGASLVADATESSNQRSGNDKKIKTNGNISCNSKSSGPRSTSGSSRGSNESTSDKSLGYDSAHGSITSSRPGNHRIHPHIGSREARLEPLVFHPTYTWLRAKAPGERTVEHCDWYHFEDCSGFWTPSEAAVVQHLAALRDLDKVSNMQPSNSTPAAETAAPAAPLSTVAPSTAAASSVGLEIDNRACAECGIGGSSNANNDEVDKDGNDDASMLLCDECSAPCHGACATPPLNPEAIASLLADPDGLWFCRNCAPITSAPRPVFGSAWIPLEPVPRTRGGLAVVPGSHRLPAFKRRTTQHGAPLPSSFQWPGPLEAPPPSSPALARTAVSKSPRTTAAAPAPATDLRGWATSDYLPGDVVLFDLRTVHATGTNNHFLPGSFSPRGDKNTTTSLEKAAKGSPRPGANAHDIRTHAASSNTSITDTAARASSTLPHENVAAAKAAADSFRLSIDTRWCLRPKNRPNWGTTPSSMFIEAVAALGKDDGDGQ